MHIRLIIAACGLVPVVPASAQSIGFGAGSAEILLVRNDPAPAALGNPDFVYTAFAGQRINNAGDWAARTTINGAANFNNLLIRNPNELVVRQGLPVPEIEGAFHGRADDFALANDGTLVHTSPLFQQPRPGDSALFLDGRLMFQSGRVSTAAGLEGAVYFRLDAAAGVQINDNNQILLYATMRDPSLPPEENQRALVRLDYDRDTLAFTETLVTKSGRLMTGGDGVTQLGSVGTSNQQLAFDDAGRTMYVGTRRGGSASDAFIAVDDAILAQTGGPSLWAGRTYATIQGSAVALGNDGSFAYTAVLSGTETAANRSYIARNNEIFVRSGDVVDGFTIGALSGKPVQLSDAGDLLWGAQLVGVPSTENDAIFFNDRVLIKQGDVVGGRRLVGLPSTQDAYRMSTDGTWLIAQGNFDRIDGVSGTEQVLFRVAIPEPSAALAVAGLAGFALRRRRACGKIS